MEYKGRILLLMCLCILMGCSSNKQKSKSAEEIELTGKQWNVTDDLGRTYDMGIVGDFMYLTKIGRAHV